jgi:hypothetical protein
MNDYDLHVARQRFGRGSTPNRLALVITVERLAEWADTVSDGWAYWRKPLQAAQRAIELIDGLNTDERADITEQEMLTAVKPIKAFLTRCSKIPHGLHPQRPMVTPEERELILRATEPMFQVVGYDEHDETAVAEHAVLAGDPGAVL